MTPPVSLVDELIEWIDDLDAFHRRWGTTADDINDLIQRKRSIIERLRVWETLYVPTGSWRPAGSAPGGVLPS